MRALRRILMYKPTGTIAIVTAGNDLNPWKATEEKPAELAAMIAEAFKLCKDCGCTLKIVYGVPRSDTYKMVEGIDF